MVILITLECAHLNYCDKVKQCPNGIALAILFHNCHSDGAKLREPFNGTLQISGFLKYAHTPLIYATNTQRISCSTCTKLLFFLFFLAVLASHESRYCPRSHCGLEKPSLTAALWRQIAFPLFFVPFIRLLVTLATIIHLIILGVS